MKECIATDTLLSIVEALDWRTEAGLHHLQSCAECRERLQTLERVHGMLDDRPEVPEETLARVTEAIRLEAGKEQGRFRGLERLARLTEVLLSGASAAVVLASAQANLHGNPIPLVVAFVIGSSAVLLWHRRKARLEFE